MQTIGLTRWILKKFVILIKDSALFAVIVNLLGFLNREFKSSKFFELTTRFVGFMKLHYASSLLKKYISGNSSVQIAYENSFLCTIVCNVFKLLSLITGKAYNLFSKLVKGGLIDSVAYCVRSKKFYSYANMLALYIVCMLICPHEIWNNLYAVLAAFVFLAWYMARTYKNLEKPDIKSEGFGLVVFVIFAGLSGVYAYDKADAVRIILFLYSAIIFGFLVRQSVNTEDKLTAVLKIISTGAFITSVIGILQRIQGVEVNPEYVDVLANASMPGRVFSTFANPNNFAELLVLTMPATAALVFVSNTKKERYIWLAFLATDFAAIGMSYSRSCWVALCIAAIVMLLIYDWKLLVPCIVIFLVIFPFLPESITDRILTIGSMKDTSNASRLYIWSGAWRMIERYFVSGVGAGPLTFAKYYFPLADRLALTSPHAHMLYMELVIEFGIFAFAGFVIYMIFVMKKAFSAVSHASKNNKAIIGALIGSMFGMAFVFAVEYVWFYPRDMFMFWIVLGLLSAACRVVCAKQNER